MSMLIDLEGWGVEGIVLPQACVAPMLHNFFFNRRVGVNSL